MWNERTARRRTTVETLPRRSRFPGSAQDGARVVRQDDVAAGQQFEVERLDRGEYLLKRKSEPRNAGLVNLLLACPAKGWFKPIERTETTDDLTPPAIG